MSGLVLFAFWLATALFLVCAYPISPPGAVKGFSATMMADALFLISTCCLVLFTFNRGRARRRDARKKRRIRRGAYILLCGIILFGFYAVRDLARRGREDITLPLMALYGILLFLFLSLFFALRYWHNNTE